MSSVNQKVFSVTRSDLLYNFASSFQEVFAFASFSSDKPSTDTGISYQDAIGFDFQKECSPFVRIAPPTQDALETSGLKRNELEINITVEDTALGIRRLFYSLQMSEIDEARKVHIDLSTLAGMSFFRGFKVSCGINLRKTADSKTQPVWHRSQLIHASVFEVKATSDEALFEISWQTFKDKQDATEILMFVDWLSNDVSSTPSTDCFNVVGNNDLRNQFKRLDSNNHFGPLTIRLVAQNVLHEIVFTCLQQCDLNSPPNEDSLHAKVQALFDENSIEFSEIARESQSGNKLEQLQASSTVSKFIQRLNSVGSTLADTRFGGYRS